MYDDTLLFLTDDEKPDHICHIDCQLIEERVNGQMKRKHIMYSASPTSAAGRYQYDQNRAIYTTGKGARAAMRATGQSDTRTNREWNLGRKLWREAHERITNGMSPARSDAIYRASANEVFGPDRRPYRSHKLRSQYRRNVELRELRRQLAPRNPWLYDRPAYLLDSEHDPNL